MQFKIENTRQYKPLKVVLYGSEGIGKTTFASHFPEPIFIDTDNAGTGFIDAKKLPDPSDWSMLIEEIKFAAQSKPGKTLVIDTMDWTEILAKQYLMKKHNWKAIDSANYGAKYVELAQCISDFLKELNSVINAGMNVVITAHAQMRKQELPDEMGAFDRYELKLERRDNALVKEWADLLFFANYKTTVVTGSNNNHKATGGERVMYTQHRPTWDAKNRLGLPEELPFDYEAIRGPLEQAMGMQTDPVPAEIVAKLQASKLDLQALQAILYQGKFVATGTPISQVPDQTWQHINNHWNDALNFYKQLQNQN